MFRCGLNISKLNKSAGSLRQRKVFIRKYDVPPFKRYSMDELPIPKGSWSSNYAKRNAVNNAFLLVGVGAFGATLTYAIKSGLFDAAMGPEIGPSKEEKMASEAIKLSEVSNETKATIEDKKTPKSEEEFHVVEVLFPPSEKKAPVEHDTSLDSFSEGVSVGDSDSSHSSITEDSPVKSFSKDSPVEASVGDSPVESSTEDSPVESSTDTSPVDSSTEASPVESFSEDTLVESSTEDLPLESISEDSPVESVSKDSPVESVSEDSPVESISEDSIVESSTEDSPVKSSIVDNKNVQTETN